ncbi:hypothetical protein [Amycolatopsis tolypomycina]|uniref:Uncharacterized protein n=1 Tax=Amycolatopsis tolypomycina TaxID=208445 RepID=A0A1H5CGW2_9PSEU|nr:hypothetical protein [Amycolatopsis tolypomycina]SED65837.1 hypothetical protein SAMN04489727_8773 [Amycolatopsis tolypomycina]
MTGKISMRMHRADGRQVNLADLLNLIPGDDFCWSFLDFEGVGGTGPRGESILEFEELVENGGVGYVLSWPELVWFAGQLKQVINCWLVAVRVAADLEHVSEEGGAEVVVEAFDSTTWEVQATDQELVRRFSGFAAVDRAD